MGTGASSTALCHNGAYVEHTGYITDILNRLAVKFVSKGHRRPWSLFFAHKAVHPDAAQASDGTLVIEAAGGYRVADRHRDLYRDAVFPRKPNMLDPAQVVKDKPAWAEAFALRTSDARARCSIACTPASRRRSACGPA